MKIKVAKPVQSFATKLAIDVAYENPTKAPLKLEDPSTSFDVELHLVDVGTKEDHSYTMGSLQPTVHDPAHNQFALVQPAKRFVEVPPGGVYRFVSEASERLYLRPGAFDCYLTTPQGESNHLALELLYDKPSVEALLAVLTDRRQSYGRREWAMDWLKKLYPGLSLDLPLDDDPPQVRASKEAANKGSLDMLVQWWRASSDKIDLDKALRDPGTW